MMLIQFLAALAVIFPHHAQPYFLEEKPMLRLVAELPNSLKYNNVENILQQFNNSSRNLSSDNYCGVKKGLRIVGGLQAIEDEFPWMVYMMVKIKKDTFSCGGSLISDEWVLTAAHCIQPQGSSMTTVKVFIGAHGILSDMDFDSRFEVKASKWMRHPNYKDDAYEYDIGLIKIPSIKNDVPDFTPLCLPFGFRHVNDENVAAITAGWGTTSGGGAGSAVLKKLETRTLDFHECRKISLIMYTHLTKDMLCISPMVLSKGTVCNGDSGGPLFTDLNQDGISYQIGLTSFGDLNCPKESPAAFTRVSHYLEFICSSSGVCS